MINTGNSVLNVAEAATHLRVSRSWLNKLRLLGGGPPYLKLGRRVVYQAEDLATWAAARRQTSTSSNTC
jgi:predicted DNA-binding transcriptional regulator AlpA